MAPVPKPELAAPDESQSKLHFTLSFDLALSPDKNFTPDAVLPVIESWVQQRLSAETLTIDEFRRLARMIPTRDVDGLAPGRVAQRLRPIAVSDLESANALVGNALVGIVPQEPDATVDNLIQTVSFQEPLTVPDAAGDDKSGVPQDQDRDSQGQTKSAQDESRLPAQVSPVETVKTLIEQQKKLINENESIDEVVKAAKLEQLNSASTAIQQATVSQALIDLRKSERENFTKELERLTQLRDNPIKPATPDQSRSSDNLGIELQEKRQLLQEQRTRLDNVKRLLEKREKRITDIPSLRTAVSNRLNTFQKRFEEFASQPDDQEKQFSTLALNAQQLAAQKENEALDIDLLYQEQFGRLWLLDRDVLSRNIKVFESEISQWESAISRRREVEVAEQQRQAREAQEMAIKADPSLKPLAHRNQELAQIRSELTNSIKTAGEEVKQVTAKFKETDAKLTSLKQISDTGKLTTSNGMLLVEHRRSLTPTFESQARIQEIKTELQIIRLANLKLTEEQEGLASTDEIVRELVNQYESQSTPSSISLDRFEQLAHELATTQRTYLQNLEKDYDIYLKKLAEIETNRLSLINKIRETRDYIDEQALWIRSANPVSLLSDIPESQAALTAYFNGRSWFNLGQLARNRIVQRPYETAFAGFGLIGLLVATRRMRPTHD